MYCEIYRGSYVRQVISLNMLSSLNKDIIIIIIIFNIIIIIIIRKKQVCVKVNALNTSAKFKPHAFQSLRLGQTG